MPATMSSGILEIAAEMAKEREHATIILLVASQMVPGISRRKVLCYQLEI